MLFESQNTLRWLKDRTGLQDSRKIERRTGLQSAIVCSLKLDSCLQIG